MEWLRQDRRTLAVDGVLWLVLCTPVVAGLLLPDGGPDGGRYLVGGLVGGPALGLAVLAGRRHPVLPVLVATALSLLNGNWVFAVPVTSYLLGLRGAPARPAALTFAAIAATGTVVIAATEDVGAWVDAAALLLLAGVTPWLLGRCWRQYRELVRSGWEQAERMERERHALAEQARLRERSRIA